MFTEKSNESNKAWIESVTEENIKLWNYLELSLAMIKLRKNDLIVLF